MCKILNVKSFTNWISSPVVVGCFGKGSFPSFVYSTNTILVFVSFRQMVDCLLGDRNGVFVNFDPTQALFVASFQVIASHCTSSIDNGFVPFYQHGGLSDEVDFRSMWLPWCHCDSGESTLKANTPNQTGCSQKCLIDNKRLSSKHTKAVLSDYRLRLQWLSDSKLIDSHHTENIFISTQQFDHSDMSFLLHVGNGGPNHSACFTSLNYIVGHLSTSLVQFWNRTPAKDNFVCCDRIEINGASWRSGFV